jgi:hypothetical protein
LFRRLGCRQRLLPKASQHMVDESRSVAMGQLLVLFKRIGSVNRRPPPSPFVGLRYAPASSRTGRGAGTQARMRQTCPGLLSTKSVLVCFTHDKK